MALHAGLTDETGRQDRSKVFITGSGWWCTSVTTTLLDDSNFQKLPLTQPYLLSGDDWRPPSQTPTKALLGLTLVSPRSYWINGEYMHLLTFPDFVSILLSEAV